MSELLALADRCDADTAPDWNLNAEIEIAVRGFPEKAYQRQNGIRPKGTPNIDRLEFVRKGWASDYTGSLTDAISLYLILPNLVPSCPRKATADALRQRAGEER